ncbi:MAG: ABC transporter ATP-binding protein [Candidatus Caldarchaeum sp.]|nr:ABC transporter ATP-binding protein [Candidatus Caldarchaeum sp.]MCS7138185.1 ABC transporter ATP-binding protein [Candidatus Caldarchaeum sp.]MDW7977305.1 ABC transporter ATP-binding protein [Candidatus Caldarchaeum sp.]MDW8360045.1 ABC transporter ATP-binding protein [Candidatus Caldarchaeum sp.]
MKASRLSAGYGRRVVVSSVELELQPGELTVVVGPNASGKTTLLKTLAAILKPVAGAVYLSGEDLSCISSRRRARMVAAVLTGRPDVGGMTVEEVVAMGRYPWTGPAHILGPRDRKAVEEAMEKTAVSHLRERRVSELSDGQFQRVVMARALAQQPQALILDEPTTHLDSRSRLEVFTLLRRLAHVDGLTVVASTHELELAFRFADKLVLVADGDVVVADDPEAMALDRRFLHAFGLDEKLRLSPATLSVEFTSDAEMNQGPSVFVIAGAGTGAPVYRALTKQGYRINTGVLHENDIDYHVASSLGLNVVAEKPFQPIGAETFQRAVNAFDVSDAVVYTCPPIGGLNVRNLELLRKSLGKGLPTYILSTTGATYFEGVETVHSVRMLLEKLPTAQEKKMKTV